MIHTDNALHKKTLYFVRTLSLHVDPVVPLSSLPFVSSDPDDSDVDIIEVIDKSVDKKKMLKLEKINALKKIDPNPSFTIDPIVALSSSPFVSSDAMTEAMFCTSSNLLRLLTSVKNGP